MKSENEKVEFIHKYWDAEDAKTMMAKLDCYGFKYKTGFGLNRDSEMVYIIRAKMTRRENALFNGIKD